MADASKEEGITTITTYKECYDLINNTLDVTRILYAFDWARYNYAKFAEFSAFEELNAEYLLELIRSDEVNVLNEEIVFDPILRWLEVEKNKEMKLEVMKEIRIAAVSPKYLLDVIEPVCWEEYEKKPLKPTCRRYFHSAIIWHLLPARREGINNEFSIPRKYFSRVLAVGGYEHANGVIEEYNTDSKIWTELKTFNIQRTFYEVGLVQNKLMFIGGQLRTNKTCNIVESYNILTGESKSESSMIEARSCLGVVVLDYEKPITIYAIGGMKENKSLQTVEKWDEESQTWTSVASMNQPRDGLGVVTLNNIIYACGGNNGNNKYHKSLESYDPKTNEWTMRASMSQNRSYFKMATVGGMIYAFGGYGMGYGILGFDTWERYDPRTDTWTEMPKLNSTASVGAGVISGRLFYVGGGGSRGSGRKDGEEYDISKGKWKKIADLNHAREGLTIINVPYELRVTKLCQ